MTKEENELLTRVGPGTPCGDLMRRYWQPAALSEELPQGGAPLPYKRLIINGCRPFDRLKDFPPVNLFSESARSETWDKWKMADWLKENV